MDEQNPRVTADDLRGRGDDAVAGYGERDRRTESPDEAATTRTREIRAEIAQTRGELSETVDAIQDRLRPANLASQAASSVKEAALDKAHEVAESEHEKQGDEPLGGEEAEECLCHRLERLCG